MSDEIIRKGKEKLVFEAYRGSYYSGIIFHAIVIVSFGLIGAIARFYPRLFCKWVRSRCSFKNCTHVLVERDSKYYEVVPVVCFDERYIEFRKERFVYNEITQTFVHQSAKLKDVLPSQLQALFQRGGLTGLEAHQLLAKNGPNEIRIDDVPILTMLIDKITQIFYLFQIASVMIWLFQGYTFYAWLILFMSSVSVLWEIYSAKMNEKQLRSLTEGDNNFYYVLRDHQTLKIPVADLVVGDIVVLTAEALLPKNKLPCDFVLMQGECLVDESSLTGETVPVLKLSLQIPEKSFESALDQERNRSNILYGGSTIQQLRPKNKKFKPPSREPSLEILDGSIIRKSELNHQRTFHLESRPNPDDKSVLAIVLSTGFSSSKGDLFKSILFPSEVELKLNKDSMSFLMILGAIAFVAFLNKMINGYIDGNNLLYTFIISLDLITIAVPPALPLILTVGISFSVERLKRSLIFCIDPERLHYAGRLDTMCWDKTGTITVPSLIFAGVHHPQEQEELSQDMLDFSPSKVMMYPVCLERFMVACHGLTRPDNEYLGHALDIETFRMTGWAIEKHQQTVLFQNWHLPCVLGISDGGSSIYIVKRFEFDAHLQRSSVIAISKDFPAYLYAKGSPESIKFLCNSSSIPSNFDSMCSRYSSEGYYVIALAAKIIDPSMLGSLDQLSRNQVENELEFHGFLLFENPIKKQAYPTFTALSEANISSIIITGDNALTAVHVARKLRLVNTVYMVDKDDSGLFYLILESSAESLAEAFLQPRRFDISSIADLVHDSYIDVAMTGSALVDLQQNEKWLLELLMPRTIIFSRAKPDQKTWIIEWLIKHGRQVGMCGDGTNDCGALKAAHVGLALSSSEASIVAPFTSAQKQISDLIHLVKEGRCSLETSFVGFKYMTLYPLIQLMISATLNQMGTSLSSNQYLMDDVAIVTTLALFALYTQPISGLKKSRPVDTLFSPEILVSLGGQLFLCIFWFAMNAILTFNATSWFCPVSKAISQLDTSFVPRNASRGAANYPCFPIDADYDTSLSFLIKSHENTSLWTFGHFQFVIAILAISIVSQYRKAFWTNKWFTCYTVFIFVVLSAQLLLLTNSATATVPGDPFNPEYNFFLSAWFNVAPGIPFSFRVLQFLFILFHLTSAVVWEISWDWYRHERMSLPRSHEFLPLI